MNAYLMNASFAYVNIAFQKTIVLYCDWSVGEVWYLLVIFYPIDL